MLFAQRVLASQIPLAERYPTPYASDYPFSHPQNPSLKLPRLTFYRQTIYRSRSLSIAQNLLLLFQY